MRGLFVVALSFLLCTVALSAQVSSSASLGCTVVGSGMACNGIGVLDPKDGERKLPRLFVTHFVVEPGGVLERTTSDDFLIIGINGGDLLNEKAPFLHVSLAKDEVTLMPKEREFRLRNATSANVEFRMIEIQR